MLTPILPLQNKTFARIALLLSFEESLSKKREESKTAAKENVDFCPTQVCANRCSNEPVCLVAGY
jgi:hypothetical protein